MWFGSRIKMCLITGGLLSLGLAGTVWGATGADLVVLGEVYTMSNAQPHAGGFAVRDGRIIYVGKASEAKKRLRPGGELIRLKPGQTVLPGLIDSHVHMLDAGVLHEQCALGEPKTKEEMLATIAKYAQAHPELTWVIGSGWPPTFFDENGPRKSELDAVISDRPAVFYGQDGHSAWLNSAALAAAHINEKPDPPGGRIIRDATGEPSGTVLEAAADLVMEYVPKPSREMMLAGLDYSQKYLHSFGITMVQDANVDLDNLETYSDAARSGKLTMKVVAAQATDPNKSADQVDELVRRRDSFAYGRLTVGTAKIFIDGVLEFRTAALIEPYEGGGNERGMLRWKTETLKELAIRLEREGFQMHMHVIGDGAARQALDAIAAARAVNGVTDNRHQLAHLELIDPADIPRLDKLGVIANFEPFWMYADESITKNTIPLIGNERGNRLYPIRSVAKGGALVTAGSDWPVSTPNPFLAMEVGITRQSPTRPHGAPWIPRERISLKTLLTAYTIAGAYVNHREYETGSLEAGKAADFIIIDRNPFNIRPHVIGKTVVLRTFVDGQQVYEYQPAGTDLRH